MTTCQCFKGKMNIEVKLQPCGKDSIQHIFLSCGVSVCWKIQQ